MANGLRSLGVKRGDRILLMLGNVVPLWEVMLAAMKLGAVVIPATTLLVSNDLADRFDRGRARHVVTTSSDAPKFDGLDSSLTRIAVGEPVPGWTATIRCWPRRRNSRRTARPGGRSDAALLHLRHDGEAKAGAAFAPLYPVGHLSTMYALGLLPGDIHLNVSSPGWAKHAWSCFFAPWIAGAAVFIANQGRFHARTLLDTIAANKVTTLCAPPTVWRMLIQEDLKSLRHSLREVLGAGEPLNPEVIDQVRAAWGLTVRDFYGQTETSAQVGNPPDQPIKPGSMGRPLPGFRTLLLDPNDQEVEEGELSLALDPPPAGLMRGYQQDDGSIAGLTGAAYRTGDVVSRDADGLPDVCRTGGRCVQGVRLPDQPVRVGEHTDRTSRHCRGRGRARTRPRKARGAKGLRGSGCWRNR